MTGFSLFQSTGLADIVGVCIILSIALGAFSLMWMDYKTILRSMTTSIFMSWILSQGAVVYIYLSCLCFPGRG